MSRFVRSTPPPAPRRQPPLPLEEFFRTVVFGADTAREERRRANTARMDTADYWREEFSAPWQGSPEPGVPPGESAPAGAGQRPGARHGRPGGGPHPDGPLGADKSLLPGLLQFAPGTDAVLRNGLAAQPRPGTAAPGQPAAPGRSGAEATVQQPAPAPGKPTPTLDGSALDAGRLFLHYLEGSKNELQMDFNDVDTSGVSPEQFPGFREAVENLRAAGGGTTTVALKKTYSTKGMQHAALGHITLLLNGRLTVDENGWRLDGDLGSDPDTYNFDEKEWGERGYAAEFSTRAGKFMGSIFGGEDFTISINGKRPISSRGSL